MTMLLFHMVSHEDVIHIDDHNCIICEFIEDVHHYLECCQTIHETEKHDQGFKQASVCPKGCLPLVSFLDLYIVVSPMDV